MNEIGQGHDHHVSTPLLHALVSFLRRRGIVRLGGETGKLHLMTRGSEPLVPGMMVILVSIKMLFLYPFKPSLSPVISESLVPLWTEVRSRYSHPRNSRFPTEQFNFLGNFNNRCHILSKSLKQLHVKKEKRALYT